MFSHETDPYNGKQFAALQKMPEHSLYAVHAAVVQGTYCMQVS
jgi:hypothetical protein